MGVSRGNNKKKTNTIYPSTLYVCVFGHSLIMFIIGLTTSRMALSGGGIRAPAAPAVESTMNFNRSVRPLSSPAIKPSEILSMVGCNDINTMAAANSEMEK